MCPRRHLFRRLGRFPALIVVTVLVLLVGVAPATAEEGQLPAPTDAATAPVDPGTDADADADTGETDDPADAIEPTAPGTNEPGTNEPGTDEPTAPTDQEMVETPPASLEPQEQTDADASPSPHQPSGKPSASGKEPGVTSKRAPSLTSQPQSDGAASSLAAPDALTAIRLEPKNSEVTVGESVTFVVWADGAPDSTPTDVTSQATFEFVGGSGHCAGAVCSSERAGSFAVKATYAGFTDLAYLSAEPGEGVSLSLTPSTATVLRNQIRIFQPVMRDDYGNAISGGAPAADYEFGELDCEVSSSMIKCSGATAGEYPIVATLHDDPTQTATATLVVEPGNGVVKNLTVEASSPQVQAGQPFQVTASGIDTAGDPLDVTDETTFTITTTDGNAFNKVDGSCTGGQCSIRSAGSFFIRAEYGDLGANVGIDVRSADPVSLKVTPAVAHVGEAEPQWYQVFGVDAFGNEALVDSAQVVLSTDEPAMCQVNICGSLEAGTYAVRAAALGLSATAEFTAHPAAEAAVDQVARIVVAQAPTGMGVGPATAGQPAEFVVYGFDAQDRPLGTVTDESTLSIEGAGSWTTPVGTQSLECAANTCTATVAGTHTVTSTLGELSATTAFQVVADHESVRSGLTPGNAVVHVGEHQSYGLGSQDEYGNQNGSMSAPFRMPFIPSEGATCDEDSCWADQPGTYLIGLDMDVFAQRLGQESGPDSNWIYAAVLTVLPAELDHIEVTADHASVPAGTDVTLTATAYDAGDNVVGDVTDSTIFQAGNQMNCTQNVCRSTVPGAYEIEGTHEGLVDSTQVSVTAAEADHDVLTPTDSTIRVGEVVDYTVTRVDEFDNTIGDVTDDYTFTVGTDDACEAARCTSRQPGDHAVTARASGHPDLTAQITVVLPDSAYLVLTPGSASVAAGVEAPFVATLHDVEGLPVADVTAETSFTASDVATCTAAACSSTAVGTYTVSGSYGDLADDADLTVTPAPVERITMSPDGATIDAGATQNFSVSGYDEFDNPVGDLTGDASFEITAPGECTTNECGATAGGDFTVTASYVVPSVTGVPGPVGPVGRTARLREAAAAAAPGTTLTASASLTVRASDDDTPGDDDGGNQGGGNDDAGNDDAGNHDGGDQNTGDDASGDENADGAPTASAQPDHDSALPATGAGIEGWQIGTALLLLLTGLACLRRVRRRDGVSL